MLKACKRNFDCLSLYDDNNSHDSYSSTSPYYPTRKRVCNEFNDNMYISEDSLLFSTEEVTIPKIHQTSPKTTTNSSPSSTFASSSLRSFSAPISPFSQQNENLPNNSKHPKISFSSFSPFSSPSSSSSSPLFFNSPSCSQNNFNINNNNNNNNINNNNVNNNNIINNNNNINNNYNEKMEKNYFNLSNEFFDPKTQFQNQKNEENQNNNNNNNNNNEENSLLNRLIESKLRDNKSKKNLDLIFTVEDIKEIVFRAIQERDEELHEEFSAKLTEKLIEQQNQFASYNEEKIAAKLKNSKFDYMS